MTTITDTLSVVTPAAGVPGPSQGQWTYADYAAIPGDERYELVGVELSPAVRVQPDVIVMRAANVDIITPSYIIGSPDLVVEIASPSTAGYDRREKQDTYASAGVMEYWIADPAAGPIELVLRDGDAHRSKGAFRGKAQLPSQVVPELPVQAEQFFA